MEIAKTAKKVAMTQMVNLALNASDENIIRGTKVIEKFSSDERVKSWIKAVRGMIEKKNVAYQQIKNMQKDLSPACKKKLVSNMLVQFGVFAKETRIAKQKELGFFPPSLLVIDVTDRCNLKCQGCWAANCTDKEDMSMELLDRLMEEAKELGIYFMSITGGEPFIRKDMMDFFERHNDMYFQVYTNGTCITKEMAKKLGELGNVAPAISVEGFKEETNARRGPMTYDRISQTMGWLKEYGVLFGFSSMATKENIELLGSEEFIDHWMEKGCKFGWVFQYIPIGRCPEVGLMATPEQRVQLRKNVEKIRETKPFFLGDFWNDGHYVYGCMAGGKTYLHITNNGSVEPCVFAHFSVDNINDKSLIEVLNSDFFKAIRDGHPHSKNKNLLAPCMIIDHPEVLRKFVKDHGAKGTHKEEEQIVNDEKVKKHLDEYSKKILELTDPEWEGPYHKFFKYWFVDHKGRYD
jgi:MoaA/NifB/PqqE/SkfB family radical SAM enzyme